MNQEIKHIILTEAQFATQVEDLLTRFGWMFYHVYEQFKHAKRSSKGFPDYVAMRNGRLLFIEIKSQHGKLSPDQQTWLEGLARCQSGDMPEIYVWWPAAFDDILEILR